LPKGKRIEELRNESLLAYDGGGPIDGDASYFAIFAVVLVFLFIATDKRKSGRRTGWRGWLRGRF